MHRENLQNAAQPAEGSGGVRQATVALTLGIMTTLCTGCTKIMWHFRACFKHFKESIVLLTPPSIPLFPNILMRLGHDIENC